MSRNESCLSSAHPSLPIQSYCVFGCLLAVVLEIGTSQTLNGFVTVTSVNAELEQKFFHWVEIDVPGGEGSECSISIVQLLRQLSFLLIDIQNIWQFA